MSSASIQVEHLQDDDLVTRERKKCEDPMTLFGGITVGVNKVTLPEKYLLHSEEILDLQVRPDDVWVISNPRSGTTWTEELVWLLTHNLDYESASATALHKRFRFLEVYMFFKTDDVVAQNELQGIDTLNACPSPRFIKTHLHFDLLPKQLWTVKPKIIFVFRNPKDVVISRYHFSKLKFIAKYEGSFNDFAEIFLRDKCVYAPFWKQVVDFWKMRNQNNILFLTYEEMKQDLTKAIHKVANYLGVTLTIDEVAKLAHHLNFDNMKENNAVNFTKQSAHSPFAFQSDGSNFIRAGTSQQWKTKMNQTLTEKFDRWSRKQIEGTDFPVHWAC